MSQTKDWGDNVNRLRVLAALAEKSSVPGTDVSQGLTSVTLAPGHGMLSAGLSGYSHVHTYT